MPTLVQEASQPADQQAARVEVAPERVLTLWVQSYTKTQKVTFHAEELGIGYIANILAPGLEGARPSWCPDPLPERRRPFSSETVGQAATLASAFLHDDGDSDAEVHVRETAGGEMIASVNGRDMFRASEEAGYTSLHRRLPESVLSSFAEVSRTPARVGTLISCRRFWHAWRARYPLASAGLHAWRVHTTVSGMCPNVSDAAIDVHRYAIISPCRVSDQALNALVSLGVISDVRCYPILVDLNSSSCRAALGDFISRSLDQLFVSQSKEPIGRTAISQMRWAHNLSDSYQLFLAGLSVLKESIDEAAGGSDDGMWIAGGLGITATAQRALTRYRAAINRPSVLRGVSRRAQQVVPILPTNLRQTTSSSS